MTIIYSKKPYDPNQRPTVIFTKRAATVSPSRSKKQNGALLLKQTTSVPIDHNQVAFKTILLSSSFSQLQTESGTITSVQSMAYCCNDFFCNIGHGIGKQFDTSFPKVL